MHVVLMQKLHLIPRARNVYNCICVYLSPIEAVQTQTHGAAASRAPQWHDAVKDFRGGMERPGHAADEEGEIGARSMQMSRREGAKQGASHQRAVSRSRAA